MDLRPKKNTCTVNAKTSSCGVVCWRDGVAGWGFFDTKGGSFLRPIPFLLLNLPLIVLHILLLPPNLTLIYASPLGRSPLSASSFTLSGHSLFSLFNFFIFILFFHSQFNMQFSFYLWLLKSKNWFFNPLSHCPHSHPCF